MKIHFIGIALGVILGVPAVAFGSSFISSLVQGKTPAEAVYVVSEQLDSLLGRVSEIESEQEELTERVIILEESVAEKPVESIPAESVQEENEEHQLFQFTLDSETQDLCNEALAESEPSNNSLRGQVSMLCVRAQTEKFESREEYDELVLKIQEKSDLSAKVNATYEE